MITLKSNRFSARLSYSRDSLESSNKSCEAIIVMGSGNGETPYLMSGYLASDSDMT